VLAEETLEKCVRMIRTHATLLAAIKTLSVGSSEIKLDVSANLDLLAMEKLV